MEIVGTRGSAVLRDKDIETWSFAERAAWDDEIVVSPPPRTEPGVVSSANDPTVGITHGHAEQFRDLMLAIEERRQPVLDGREARKPVQVIEAIYRSAREGRAVAPGLKFGFALTATGRGGMLDRTLRRHAWPSSSSREWISPWCCTRTIMSGW